MLFHTWIFFLFFLIFYSIYLAVHKTRFRVLWILIASYIFYGWWNPYYLLLLLYATSMDYWLTWGMSKGDKKERWLWGSIINNVGLLGFFKYYHFFTDNLNVLVRAIGLTYPFPPLDIFLPVGISFYIFKSLSYAIDCYRGEIERERSFIHYAVYVSFFPQIIQGPIERAKNLLIQIHEPSRISGQDIADGLSLFIVGLFKKTALANYLALYVDRIYAAPDQYQSPALIFATFAFGWQLYFDFSGYTDMARGIGRLMGFQLMLNFNHPYLATGFSDFWARWHISLSNWLRDYIYTPLIAVGRSRNANWIISRNVMITFLISGLWHGAAWTFVIWGGLHAVGILLTRELEKIRWYKKRCPKWVKQLWTYAAINFAWIFFRASDFQEAGTVISRIFSFGWADPSFPLLALSLIGSAFVYQYLYESKLRSLLELSYIRFSLVLVMIIYLLIIPGTSEKPFIYLRF